MDAGNTSRAAAALNDAAKSTQKAVNYAKSAGLSASASSAQVGSAMYKKVKKAITKNDE
jgi:hypothetical protein